MIYEDPEDNSSWVSRAAALAQQINDVPSLPEKTISIIGLDNAPYSPAINAINGSLIFSKDTSRFHSEVLRISNLYEENYLWESF